MKKIISDGTLTCDICGQTIAEGYEGNEYADHNVLCDDCANSNDTENARGSINRAINACDFMYCNDSGNGCAGPSLLTQESLREIDPTEYEICEEWQDIESDGKTRTALEIIADTLAAHGSEDNPENYVLLHRMEDTGSNPYHHYILAPKQD